MNNAYLNFDYKPVKFYLLTFLISWAALFAAAYCSYSDALKSYTYPLFSLAVITPAALAIFMIYSSGNKYLKNDFRNRLTNLKLIKPGYLIFVLLLAPVAVMLSTGISLLFGQPAEQFALSSDFFTIGGAPLLVLLVAMILAPIFEELAWRGYSVDSLAKQGRSLFISTIIFALLWDVWHWPLFLLNGYYHHVIWQTNVLYGINFIVSILPIAILHNWVYYKTNRSIPAIMLFHAMDNVAMSIWHTEQFTKCIVTIALIAASVIVLIADRSLWFDKAINAQSSTGTVASS